MADVKTLHCSLLTPDRQVLDCDASFVAIPAHDGEIGFLKNRAPLLCKLGLGSVRVESTEGDLRYLIGGGFAQMLNNQLTILTEHAENVADITADDARKQLDEALAMPATDEATRRDRQVAIARAKARLRAARTRT
jgi:F-type H+-transporting ATPase subunit epsilon